MRRAPTPRRRQDVVEAGSPCKSTSLDDDPLAGAYRTDLCLHQDRSATTSTTHVQHLGAFRRWLADHHPDTALPKVQGVHIKAFLMAEAGRGIASATPSSALFALRSFYEFLRSEELIDTNPTTKIKIPGARKLRYTEADMILAGGAISSSGAGASATSPWLPCAGRGCVATRSPCCASTRWTSTPAASRSSAKGTRPGSCPSLPRSSPFSTTA